MHMLYEVFEWAELVIDASAALIMIWGFAVAIMGFVQALFGKKVAERISRIQVVRCDLGVKLVFALELLIISDLLHTIISRSIDDLLVVGGLVVIRTVISFFLNKEIEEVSAGMSKQSGSSG